MIRAGSINRTVYYGQTGFRENVFIRRGYWTPIGVLTN